MTDKKKKFKTDDDALSFSIKDGELMVEDTDTNDTVCLAVDVEGVDEVIKILTDMKVLMASGENTEDDEEDEDEDEDEEVDEDETEEEEEEVDETQE